MPLYAKKIAAPMLCLVLLVLGTGFVTTHISVKLAALGYSSLAIASIHTIFYVGFFMGSLWMPPLVRRVGFQRATIAVLGIMTSSILLQGLWMNYWGWVVARFMTGFGLAGFYVGIEGWTLEESQENTRNLFLAIYTFVLYMATSCSQLILGSLERGLFEPFVLSAFFTTLAVLPIAFQSGNGPERSSAHDEEKPQNWALLKSAPIGMVACFASGMILSCLYSFVPAYALAHEVSPPYLMATLILGGAFGQFPVGYISGIFSRGSVLAFLSLAALPICLFLGFYTVSAYVIYPGVFLVGVLLFGIYPVGVAQMCDEISAHLILEAMGVLMLMYGLGCITGPLIAAFCSFYQYQIGSFLFPFISLVVLLMLGFQLGFSVKKSKGGPRALYGTSAQPDP